MGIKNVASGFSDIGMSSRMVRADEIELYGDNFSVYLIGYDAICVTISEPIYEAGVTSISRQQLRAIYDGNLTNWRDLGAPTLISTSWRGWSARGQATSSTRW